ncbi:MAG TPA: NifU family protein [Gemmatimonadaceae bacterium]|jgi:Fe-S cluster biogenesis protein NfuA|nr:NifU family protein [Gemmatimonadaceae bacterium]
MSVLRRKRSRPQADVEHDIRHELAEILPILRIEKCALELQGFDPDSGTATLLVTGACPDCDASAVTFIQGIETQLRLRISELRSVQLTIEGS